MREVHTFSKSFEDVKPYEDELDKYFRQAYVVTKANREQERKGVDRFFCHRKTGALYAVEYKIDHKTPATGNVFVEITSVDTADKLGWAYTSTAQVLVYFVPGYELAYRADMMAIKRKLPDWNNYPRGTAWNKSRDGAFYRTLGLLVPKEEFRTECIGEHDVAAPLDASDDWQRRRSCIHELPSEVCKVCNGSVRRQIEEAS